jgi:GAF domain-containing protein
MGPAIHVIAERAQILTRATGAAIALKNGNEIVCRARTGRTAPDLGVRLQTDSGVSAQCVRTGEVVICHDAQDDPYADKPICSHMGVRSVLAAPLRHLRTTLGVFTVLSGSPYAFDQRDVGGYAVALGCRICGSGRSGNSLCYSSAFLDTRRVSV